LFFFLKKASIKFALTAIKKRKRKEYRLTQSFSIVRPFPIGSVYFTPLEGIVKSERFAYSFKREESHAALIYGTVRGLYSA